MNATLKGFLIAPAIPGLIVLIIAMFQGGFWEGVWAAKGISLVSYIAAGLVGLPLHLLLVRVNHRGLLAYTAVGILAALVPIFFVLIFPAIASHTSQPLSSLYPIMGVMAVAGGVVAVTFWLIARPDRAPDRTAR